ncbi:MAG: DUF6439 family protein [Synechococcaceae cyanobacterium]|nr:DUF6439 family protein [Synechococcaceae cyanobacterium]
MTTFEAASAHPDAGSASATGIAPSLGRPGPSATRGWPEGADDLAEKLLGALAISDREWHAVKGQAPRRAAEQMAAALVQLLRGDDPRRSACGEGREQAIALLENALGWLQGSLKDPGCPHRAR